MPKVLILEAQERHVMSLWAVTALNKNSLNKEALNMDKAATARNAADALL